MPTQSAVWRHCRECPLTQSHIALLTVSYGDCQYDQGGWHWPVPLDEADRDADREEEQQRQDHPDEPAGAGHCALVDAVHGREGGVCVNILDAGRGLVHAWNFIYF